MSRKPRKKSESQIYHVILRGNNRQSIFFNDADRFFIINRIQKYSEQTNIELYAYCLMDNHIHLLVGKANPNLSKFVQKLATSYAMYFNRKYDRCGHLFQGRFGAGMRSNRFRRLKVHCLALHNQKTERF